MLKRIKRIIRQINNKRTIKGWKIGLQLKLKGGQDDKLRYAHEKIHKKEGLQP